MIDIIRKIVWQQISGNCLLTCDYFSICINIQNACCSMHTSLLARINVKILNNPHIDWLNSCEQKIYCVCYCCFFLTDGISDELAERVISVLFEMWLTACSASFPVPSLWRTFRDMCSNWRHHEAVIIQWNRVNYALTAPLLVKLYGPDHPELVVSKSI